jgi:hypothetical protein
VLDPATLDARAPVLDLLGVRALAAPPGAGSPVGAAVEARDAAPFSPRGGVQGPPAGGGARVSGLRRAYDGPDMTIFERPGSVPPRFWLVSGATPGGAAEAAAARRDTLASTVFLPAPDAAELGGSAAAPGEVRVMTLEPERFTVETSSPARTVLVSTQKRFAPYWRVTIDGSGARDARRERRIPRRGASSREARRRRPVRRPARRARRLGRGRARSPRRRRWRRDVRVLAEGRRAET